MSTPREQTTPDDGVPQILIQYIGTKPSTVEYIEYGIEEEGVPWCTQSIEHGTALSEKSAIEIAHQAASSSSLRIGIGITADTTHTLHHARLPAQEPVVSVQVITDSQARTIGTNAARLAKRMPLETID